MAKQFLGEIVHEGSFPHSIIAKSDHEDKWG